MSSDSIARTYAKAHDYEIDNNKELLALGASSVSVGLAQGFPISGSFSKTAVNDRNGAKTQLAGAIAAGVTILVVLYLTGFFYYLAEPVIAALIVVAVFKMVDIAGLSRIGHINKTEIYIALITFGGVLLFGILAGVSYRDGPVPHRDIVPFHLPAHGRYRPDSGDKHFRRYRASS